MVCSSSLHQIIPNILLVMGFHGRGDDNSTPALMTFSLQKVVAREEQVFFAFISDAFLPRREAAPGLISEYSNEMSMLPHTFSLPKEEIKKIKSANNEFLYTENMLNFPE